MDNGLRDRRRPGREKYIEERIQTNNIVNLAEIPYA